jgi:hypothetical protein
MFFNLSSCPAGWTPVVAARGRYLVGLPSAGTLGGTDGTALSDVEDRPVGQHTHPSIPAHTHGASSDWGFDETAPSGTVRRPLFGFRVDDSGTPLGPVTAADGGTVIGDAGSVAGTNAPYLQLLVCEKS